MRMDSQRQKFAQGLRERYWNQRLHKLQFDVTGSQNSVMRYNKAAAHMIMWEIGTYIANWTKVGLVQYNTHGMLSKTC